MSVERIKEYQETEVEAELEKPECNIKSHWPEAGKIEFDNYKTRYRKELDLVLKGENKVVFRSKSIVMCCDPDAINLKVRRFSQGLPCKTPLQTHSKQAMLLPSTQSGPNP